MPIRMHIIYPDDLPSLCAAAIIKRHAARDGSRALLYPMSTVLQCADPISIQVRDRIYPPQNEGGQLVLNKLALKHDPAKDAIFLVNAPSVDQEEEAALFQWGAVSRIEGSTLFTDSVCALAWTRFNGHRPMPLVVQLLDRYAIGSLKEDGLTFWSEEVIPISLALRSVTIDPDEDAGWEEWQKLFETLVNNQTRKRQQEGVVILRYLVATRQAHNIPHPKRRGIAEGAE